MAKMLKFLDVTRPGKGVEKGQEQNVGFKNFIELYFRKLGKYWTLNIITLLFSIPVLLLILVYRENFFAGDVLVAETRATYFYEIVTTCYYAVIGFQLTMPGLVYVLTRFANEKHAWVFADYVKYIKKNFKQSLKLFIFDVLVMIALFYLINIYNVIIPKNPLTFVSRSILYASCVVFYIMHFYIYQLMVFYNLKFKEILKKSVFFTFAFLPRNILATVITVGIAAACFCVNTAIGSILFAFTIPVIMTFLVNYVASQPINKFMPREED